MLGAGWVGGGGGWGCVRSLAKYIAAYKETQIFVILCVLCSKGNLLGFYLIAQYLSTAIANRWSRWFEESFPVSILYKSIAGLYRPVSYPDGPITARYRFIKNAYWVSSVDSKQRILNNFVV